MRKRLDLTGLSCPKVLLETKKFFKTLIPGEQVEIISTDPSTLIDFQVFTRQTHHLLLDWKQENNQTWSYILQKSFKI